MKEDTAGGRRASAGGALGVASTTAIAYASGSRSTGETWKQELADVSDLLKRIGEGEQKPETATV
jgi:hypothetical protein